MTTEATLYLAFDGVLHPNLVSFRGKCAPRLRAGGHALFENNGILQEVIDAFPSTVVILHNWWVPLLGFRSALYLLPEGVRAHVIGATYRTVKGPRARLMKNGSRRAWLAEDIMRRQPGHPVLLDCDVHQILPQLTDRACIVDGWYGLAQVGACERLLALLTAGEEPRHFAKPTLTPSLMHECVPP